MSSDSMKNMVMDYMQQGFLDNIVALFKQDESMIELIPFMISDERIRVRLGTAALVEEIMEWKPSLLPPIIPAIAALLDHEVATYRGDAAHLLEIIAHPDALPYLRAHADEPNEHAREVIRETIEALEEARREELY